MKKEEKEFNDTLQFLVERGFLNDEGKKFAYRYNEYCKLYKE